MQALFKEILKKTFPELVIDAAVVDAFIKNAHHIKLLRGKQFGAFDRDPAALGTPPLPPPPSPSLPTKNSRALRSGVPADPAPRDRDAPRAHRALRAARHHRCVCIRGARRRCVLTAPPAPADITLEALTAAVQALVGADAELPDELAAAAGELCVPSRPFLVYYLT